MEPVRYRPDLDGVRALAVLAVVASHTGAAVAASGWLGVDVFFVLSGYLITTLLIVEHAETGTIALGQFYARRILRLYPALLLALIVGVIFYRRLSHDGTLGGYAVTSAVAGLYLEDFVYGIGHQAFGGFGHTWSLAIEEQFYLVWPPLFLRIVTRRGNPVLWAASGSVLSWACCALYSLHQSADGIPDGAYYLPWSRFSQIFAGCTLALMIQRGTRIPRLISSTAGGALVVALVAALVVAATRFGRYPHLAWQAPAIAILTCAAIWHLTANADSPLRSSLGWKPLAWLGRRSYGVYLIHLPVLTVLGSTLNLHRLELSVLMLIVTIALASLSYQFVELPFLRLKRRLHPKGETSLDGLFAPGR